MSDGNRIVLRIEGLGHPPSFKNTKKIILNRRTRKPSIMTDPKKKLWMEMAIRLLESQFAGMFPTSERGTHGGCQRLSLMSSCLPFDDSLDWMIPGEQTVVRVPAGCEGVTITIERLP